MATDYRARLKLPPETIDAGHPDMLLFTFSHLLVATGFTRVVIGGRGPYIEFQLDHVVKEAFHWERAGAYYTEFRSNDIENIKAYAQLWPVEYADYKIGMWYISPFDLTDDTGASLIDPLPRGRNRR